MLTHTHVRSEVKLTVQLLSRIERRPVPLWALLTPSQQRCELIPDPSNTYRKWVESHVIYRKWVWHFICRNGRGSTTTCTLSRLYWVLQRGDIRQTDLVESFRKMLQAGWRAALPWFYFLIFSVKATDKAYCMLSGMCFTLAIIIMHCVSVVVILHIVYNSYSITLKLILQASTNCYYV